MNLRLKTVGKFSGCVPIYISKVYIIRLLTVFLLASSTIYLLWRTFSFPSLKEKRRRVTTDWQEEISVYGNERIKPHSKNTMIHTVHYDVNVSPTNDIATISMQQQRPLMFPEIRKIGNAITPSIVLKNTRKDSPSNNEEDKGILPEKKDWKTPEIQANIGHPINVTSWTKKQWKDWNTRKNTDMLHKIVEAAQTYCSDKKKCRYNQGALGSQNIFSNMTGIKFEAKTLYHWIDQIAIQQQNLSIIYDLPKPKVKPGFRDVKKILLWNSFWQLENWEIGLGQDPFIKNNCPVQSCELVRNHNLLNKSEAVLFHITELKSNEKPSYRHPDQRWIFFQMESPDFQYWNYTEYKKWNGLFNWTMTYRVDSDIHVRYGGVVPRPKRDSNKHNVPFHERENAAAWLVSNCKAPSKRMALIKELQKYFKVDIYGKCGNFTCKKSTTEKNIYNPCFKQLSRKYKFYIAFESAVCKDYATEKVFNALSYDMVPIVYGGSDYSRILPDNSYVDVQDFQSMKELASYLNMTYKTYKEHFWWRDEYKVLGYYDANPNTWCDLCQKLHQDLPNKVYNNIDTWWDKDTQCTDGKTALKRWTNSM